MRPLWPVTESLSEKGIRMSGTGRDGTGRGLTGPSH